MSVTVVSISGPSGSGKSSLVKAIMPLLSNACSLHLDYYKETTTFPSDLAKWVSGGCNPDEYVTPQMIEDLQGMRGKQNELNGWVIVEEPFGRGRKTMSGFIDYVVCIDIPLEIAFARTVKRAVHNTPDHTEVGVFKKDMIDMVDQYLSVTRNGYTIINENVKKDCNLIVDGTKDIEVLANEIITALLHFSKESHSK